MLKNKHENLSCSFSEQIISYFYEETNQTEKVALESHLKNCSTCADDLESFGFVRSAVAEWRDEEFLKIETPQIIVPVNETIQQSESVNSGSWLLGFRNIFSFSPAWMVAACALLIIFGGLIFVALNVSRNSEVAGVDNFNVEKIPASPTVENSVRQTNTNRDAAEINKFPETKSTDSSEEKLIDSKPEKVRLRQAGSSAATVKNINKTLPNSSDNSEPVHKIKETFKENKKTPTVQKQPIPTLNNLEEEEDKSVRLADLFDEIDTK